MEKQKNFDYKWVVIGLSFLMVLTCLGFCSSGRSLYTVAITEALGIKRSAFSINDSCRFISTAIVNMFFGILISRFGTKKLIMAGFTCLILSCLVYSKATSVPVFCVGGVLLGIGLSWTTTTMVGSIVNKWCAENKGTIMGFVLAANGVGGAIATQIITPLIYEEGNPFGYQTAYKVSALILLVVGLLVVLFFKENPKGKKKPQTVAHKKKARGQSWAGIEFNDAVKRPYFYIALICIFLTGMTLQGIVGIATPHLQEVGFDIKFIAAMVSVHSLFLAAFKFLTGFIYDKRGLRTTMNICLVTGIVVMILLASANNTPTGKIFVSIYEIFSSLALPLETIMIPIYANELFGQRSFDKILGIFVSVNTAGFALGAPLANWCFDVVGSYKVALIAGACILLGITILMQFVLSKAANEKKKVLMQDA